MSDAAISPNVLHVYQFTDTKQFYGEIGQKDTVPVLFATGIYNSAEQVIKDARENGPPFDITTIH